MTEEHNKILDDDKEPWHEPITDWLYRIFVRPLYNLKYYIRMRFIYRHHLINTKLPMGSWYDTDTRILHGMMNLLVDFIEKEKPFDIVCYDSDDYQRNQKVEMMEIYNWWKDYPRRQNEVENSISNWYDKKFTNCDDILDRLNMPNTEADSMRFDLIHLLEENMDKEETDMLIRLVKIRKGLWT